jgi:hypothetical protein
MYEGLSTKFQSPRSSFPKAVEKALYYFHFILTAHKAGYDEEINKSLIRILTSSFFTPGEMFLYLGINTKT